ncbi:MAG: hypothetical protein IE933_03405 [Sphingomonadales bacterium]|nr:hypothetical protein [Sphingomonadales bacterium]MBD3772088.1 hypothetical protein [Paracoccaceae bacterium]
MIVSPTARQADMLRFIAGYVEAWGFAPTITEMREALGLASKSGSARLIDALEERGQISRVPYQYRGIEVTGEVAIPRAPDGAPLHFVAIGEAL